MELELRRYRLPRPTTCIVLGLLCSLWLFGCYWCYWIVQSVLFPCSVKTNVSKLRGLCSNVSSTNQADTVAQSYPTKTSLDSYLVLHHVSSGSKIWPNRLSIIMHAWKCVRRPIATRTNLRMSACCIFPSSPSCVCWYWLSGKSCTWNRKFYTCRCAVRDAFPYIFLWTV